MPDKLPDLTTGGARLRAGAEALAMLMVTFGLAVGLHQPELWFVVPFVLITVTKRSYACYGLSWERPGGIWFHVGVITAVFVPYVVGHYLFAHWVFGAAFALRLPGGFLGNVIDQVLAIGLPEEFFFRGYLQTELDRIWGRPYALLGARWGAGLPLAAGLFAVCHTVYGGPARLIVFFPGLLYGWLRARTDTIAVPVLYHAASNLLMQVMLASLSVRRFALLM